MNLPIVAKGPVGPRIFRLDSIFQDCKSLRGVNARLTPSLVSSLFCWPGMEVSYDNYELVRVPEIPRGRMYGPEIQDPVNVWNRILTFEEKSRNRVAHSILKYAAYWDTAIGLDEQLTKFEGPYPDARHGSTKRADILLDFQMMVVECGDTPLDRLYSLLFCDGYQGLIVYPYEHMRERVRFTFMFPFRAHRKLETWRGASVRG